MKEMLVIALGIVSVGSAICLAIETLKPGTRYTFQLITTVIAIAAGFFALKIQIGF